MNRVGWIVLGATALFFVASVLISCLIDWPGLTDLPLW